MQITIEGSYSRASEVIQRGLNLIQGTTLDEILDDLSQGAQDEIIKHMMDRAEALIREEKEEREEQYQSMQTPYT